MSDEPRIKGTARRLLTALLVAAVPCGCTSLQAISPERAAVERAAIHHDLRGQTGTLYAIAAKRAKGTRFDLPDRAVVCAISNIDIRFTSEARARYAATYACGIRPWELGKDKPMATPTVILDLLKEHGTWGVNGFLYS
jgi:hypothetical protein